MSEETLEEKIARVMAGNFNFPPIGTKKESKPLPIVASAPTIQNAKTPKYNDMPPKGPDDAKLSLSSAGGGNSTSATSGAISPIPHDESPKDFTLDRLQPRSSSPSPSPSPPPSSSSEVEPEKVVPMPAKVVPRIVRPPAKQEYTPEPLQSEGENDDDDDYQSENNDDSDRKSDTEKDSNGNSDNDNDESFDIIRDVQRNDPVEAKVSAPKALQETKAPPARVTKPVTTTTNVSPRSSSTTTPTAASSSGNQQQPTTGHAQSKQRAVSTGRTRGETSPANDPNCVSPIAGGLATETTSLSFRNKPKDRPTSADKTKTTDRRSSGGGAAPSVVTTPSSSSSGLFSGQPSTFTPQHRRIPPPNQSFAPGSSSSTHHEFGEGKALTQAQLLQIVEPWSLVRRKQASAVPMSGSGGKRPPGAGLQERAIRVAVRVRPFNNGEIGANARRIISCNDDKLVIVNPNAFDADPDAIVAAAAAANCKEWAQTFKFDHCLWSYDPGDPEDEYVDQEGVHRAIGSEIVETILNGVSASCFAYGHTGTGKTHSFFGSLEPMPIRSASGYDPHHDDDFPVGDEEEDLARRGLRYTISENSGLIPRLVRDVIVGLKRRDDSCIDTKLTLSFMEIYNEKIKDLLRSDGDGDGAFHFGGEAMRVREHPLLGPYVEGLTKSEINSPAEALRLLHLGHANRTTAATERNSQSSRSHAVVVLELSPSRLDLSPAALNITRPILPMNSSKGTGGGAGSSGRNSNTSITAGNGGGAGGVAARDPFEDGTNQLFVRLQMIDLAGSEKDPASPRARPDDDDIDGGGPGAGGRPSGAYRKGKLDLSHSSVPHPRSDANGVEKTEMKMIRRSLSTLGYIIKALGKGSPFKTLPYRDSVLTWLLRDALNGRNSTTMLATLSPAHNCHEESLSTLKYAERLCMLSPRAASVGDPTFGHGPNSSFLSTSGMVGLNASGDFGQAGLGSGPFALPDDFGGGHKGNGKGEGWQTGSKAARQLLRNMVSDPQQRLAKLNSAILSGRDESAPARPQAAAQSMQIVVGDVAYSPEGIREAYRALQGSVVELQIELETARTDRDSLLVELQGVKEGLHEAHSSGSVQTSTVADLAATIKANEKEITDLRGVITRKDEKMDRVLDELGAERRARETLEINTKTQINEFLTRLEEKNRENIALMGELEKMRTSAALMVEERKLYQDEIDILRAANTSLTQTNSTQQQELRQGAVANEGLRADLAHERACSSTMEADLREATRAGERLRSEVSVLAAERDSLKGLCEQLQSSLQAQQRQSEASLKMLHQRQSALERAEREAHAQMDEWSTLQESLQSMLDTEGSRVQSELLDAKRLTGIIASLREKAQESAFLKEELDMERVARIKLQQQMQQLQIERQERDDESERERERESQRNPSNGDGPALSAASMGVSEEAFKIAQDLASNKIYQQLTEQVAQLRKAGDASEARAQYWQQVAQGRGSSDGEGSGDPNAMSSSAAPNSSSSSLAALQNENVVLKEQLQVACADAAAAKVDLQSAQEHMQREFASLWMAVQELNKIDASKERALADLIGDRDRAVRELQDAQAQLHDMTSKYNAIKRELQAIDNDLMLAAENENIRLNVGHRGQGQGGGGGPGGPGGGGRQQLQQQQDQHYYGDGSMAGDARSFSSSQSRPQSASLMGRYGGQTDFPRESQATAFSDNGRVPLSGNRRHDLDNITSAQPSGNSSRGGGGNAGPVPNMKGPPGRGMSLVDEASLKTPPLPLPLPGGGFHKRGVLPPPLPSDEDAIEKVLHNQIAELSGFLDQDRTRLQLQQSRTVLRSQSRGRVGTSSSVSSLSGK